MRVRYGKPIKVKSTYSDYFSSGAVAYRCSKVVENNIATLTKTSDNYATLYKDMTPVSGHTYFYYCKQRVLDTIGNTDRLNLSINATSGYNQNVTNPVVNEWYEFYGKSIVTGNFIRFEPRCYAPNGIRFQLTTPITIDLTEIGLDNLTAQEFYNKYNKYFPLIATGEEITIDDKAGQIAYKNLEEDSIRCKIAGGSSDIYYRYNQTCRNEKWGWDTVNGGWYNKPSNTSYSFSNGSLTLTPTEDASIKVFATYVTGSTDGTTGFPFAVDRKYYIRLKIYSTKATTWFLSSGGYNTSNFSVPANEWYTADQLLSGTSYSSSRPYFGVYMQNEISCSTSDNFIFKDLEIIDLTDWFGSGKEPTTVQEFKEKFTKEYYGFCPTPIKLTRYQIEALPNYGYNQLVKNGNFVDKTNWANSGGSTIWSVSNNILTFKAVQQYGGIRQDISIIGGHTYLFMGDVKKGNSSHSVHFTFSNFSPNDFYALDNTNWQSLSGIMVATSGVSSCILYIRDYAQSGWVDNYIKNVMLIDLTEWYGAGNEPTTVAEFKVTFPNKYYPFSKKRLLNKYMINKLIN